MSRSTIHQAHVGDESATQDDVADKEINALLGIAMALLTAVQVGTEGDQSGHLIVWSGWGRRYLCCRRRRRGRACRW